MDTEQFLARVVPPGNYIAIAYNPHPEIPNNPFAHKFFPGGSYAGAARMLKWAAGKNMDAYYAVAAFRMAEPDGVDGRGNPRYRGSRTQANAQALRCFWIDMDVKRAGDKKSAANTYPDQPAAMIWLKSFMTAISLPRPNLVVNSGYGVHVYWVLEDPMSAADWMPYGSALKAALVANGYSGDSGLSGDSARILRPPGTFNMKSGQPAPVEAFDQLSRGDYPNAMILAALQPFVGAVAASQAGQGAAQGATISNLSTGASSAVLAGSGTNMNAAAVANLPAQDRVHEFARISTKCAQVAASLSANGAGDNRPLWYLGNLSLAHFCTDGAAFVHEIGKGDPRYSPAGTDAAVAQIAADQARKGHGPPTCNHYEMNGHKGLCQTCPFHGKIKTPLVLGVDVNDLPRGYRRGALALERWVDSKDGGYWVTLIPGDVYGPALDVRPQGGFSLMFTYDHAGQTYPVRVDEPDLKLEPGALRAYFSPQSIVLTRTAAPYFGDFIVAWLEDLRAKRLARADHMLPFGWARTPKTGHAGFAVGGTLYRPDGTDEAVPGGDKELVLAFTPRGTLAAWQKACAFVIDGRPDLQVLVAASFAAPLIKLTGHKGAALSAWSRDSGVGKSSAIKVGQSVWSSASMVSSMEDTTNTIRAKTARTRVMPHYWDEVRLSKDRIPGLVGLLFELTQGKDKARMNADTSLRAVGEWETMLVFTGNAPIMDHVINDRGATDAGAVRLFEMHLPHPPSVNSSKSQKLIATTEENYGHAGRVYAKWLAMNHPEAEALVAKFGDLLDVNITPATAERLHIVTMATILAGATIATRLGLAAFDVKAMFALLRDTFFRLRQGRVDSLVVHSGAIDLEHILSNFVMDNADAKLITDTFAGRGPVAGKVSVKVMPVRARVDIHISQDDQMMRISQKTFFAWCYKNEYAANEITEGFITRWGARRERRSIAAGTQWAGGQIPMINIPLTAPELSAYTTASSAPVVPIPGKRPAALMGNQPNVP